VSGPVRLDRDGPIGRLTLSRPEKRNAQTLDLWAELGRIGAELLQRPDVRVLILTGEGPSFSAGIDLGVLGAFATGDSGLPDVEPVQRAFSWLREVPFPTIAAVQGAALGAGMQLALACDLRILAEDAVLGLPEIDLGLFPDLGGCVWLPEIVGAAKAKELIFTGARMGAAEALQLGLANRVVPNVELTAVVDALARQLAAKPPLAIAAAKRAIAAGLGDSEAGFRASAREIRRCLASADFREAARAVAERRSPAFQGR
jgi:enoyl-CoA hydratase/carnithine racemase